VNVVIIELALKMGKTVEHLSGALTVADVEDLVDASFFLDHLDVGHVIVETHIAPGPHPVLVVVLRAQSLMIPGILCATIVSNPNIVASIDQE